MSTTGKRIAAAREAKGWNQSELARALGVTPQSVQAWESGKNVPRPQRMKQISKTLDSTVSYLMGEGSLPSPDEDEEYIVELAPEWDEMPPVQRRATWLAAIASPRSQEVLARIAKAAEDGRLTEDDLLLLERIAARFEQAPTHAPAPERGSNTRLRERLRKNDPNAQQ